MARTPKIQEIPVFTKEDTCGLHRFFAFLSYFFPLGTLIMWIAFHKKSKFVRMHTKKSCRLYVITILQYVTVIVFTIILTLILRTGGNTEAALAGILGSLATYGVAAAFGVVFFIIITVVMVLWILITAIKALCGKLYGIKTVKEIIREQLNLGNPEALEIIRTDNRFADVLAEYNATQAKMQQAANNPDNTSTPDGGAK